MAPKPPKKPEIEIRKVSKNSGNVGSNSQYQSSTLQVKLHKPAPKPPINLYENQTLPNPNTPRTPRSRPPPVTQNGLQQQFYHQQQQRQELQEKQPHQFQPPYHSQNQNYQPLQDNLHSKFSQQVNLSSPKSSKSSNSNHSSGNPNNNLRNYTKNVNLIKQNSLNSPDLNRYISDQYQPKKQRQPAPKRQPQFQHPHNNLQQPHLQNFQTHQNSVQNVNFINNDAYHAMPPSQQLHHTSNNAGYHPNTKINSMQINNSSVSTPNYYHSNPQYQQQQQQPHPQFLASSPQRKMSYLDRFKFDRLENLPKPTRFNYDVEKTRICEFYK